jgi:hypothetical protein
MMRNFIVVVVITLMLLAAGWANADVCQIVNGSFEDDGTVDDITVQEPNGWEPNVPSGKFMASTDASWSTDGNFNLLLYSIWFMAFDANDAAIVSQDVVLDDVNEITFDLKLDTYSGLGWDPNIATAVVMIDDQIVWEPNSAKADIRGDYIGQSYAVQEKYRDGNPHKLSLGLRINIATQSGFFEFYRVRWDSIDCVLYCDGGGFLAGDFNHDCLVDVNDLQQVAGVWLLDVESTDKHNLFRDDDLAGIGTINFYDLAILADNWLLTSYMEQQEIDAVDVNGN